jgi:hypothetical protein
VRNRSKHTGPGESGVPATAIAEAPPARRRLDPGMPAPERPARIWSGRALVLGCLTWYLLIFGLLFLLANVSAHRSPEESGRPDQAAPPAVAPPEGARRHE